MHLKLAPHTLAKLLAIADQHGSTAPLIAAGILESLLDAVSLADVAAVNQDTANQVAAVLKAATASRTQQERTSA
jgi:hypothetical protein